MHAQGSLSGRKCRDGVLTVYLPNQEGVKPKRTAVKVG
jgi:hypothetical protein